MSDAATAIDWNFMGLLFGWFLTIGGLIWTVSKVAATTGKDIQTHSDKLNDHEKRIRLVEANSARLAAMEQNIEWIRHALERRQA